MLRHRTESLVSTRRESVLTAACLATTWLVWGSTYLGIKFALASFPPFLQMGMRFVTVAGTPNRLV